MLVKGKMEIPQNPTAMVYKLTNKKVRVKNRLAMCWVPRSGLTWTAIIQT